MLHITEVDRLVCKAPSQIKYDPGSFRMTPIMNGVN